MYRADSGNVFESWPIPGSFSAIAALEFSEIVELLAFTPESAESIGYDEIITTVSAAQDSSQGSWLYSY
jgi:hypothetical protein